MTGSSKVRKMSAREKQLLKSVKELEGKLATSIPIAKFEAVKTNMQVEIDYLQSKLSDSVPKADLEYVKNELQRICDLEGRLVPTAPKEDTGELRTRISEFEKLLRSIPRADTEPESPGLTAKIQALEFKLSELVPRTELEAAKIERESRINELQQALSESKREADALRVKINEIQPRSAAADPATSSTASCVQSPVTN